MVWIGKTTRMKERKLDSWNEYNLTPTQPQSSRLVDDSSPLIPGISLSPVSPESRYFSLISCWREKKWRISRLPKEEKAALPSPSVGDTPAKRGGEETSPDNNQSPTG